MSAVRKALVVGRDPALERFVRENFGQRGYQVASTEVKGEELKEVLVKEVPEVILLDAMMPMMDGIETCISLRQWSQIPVIVLSTWGVEEGRVRRLDLNCQDYLTEPFGIEELVEQLEEASRRNHTAGRPMGKQSTDIVVVGSSTGGPKTLRNIFSSLPRLKAGVVLVQHMPKFINDSIKRTLDRVTKMDVVVAEDGQSIEHGKAYLAPSEVHMEIMQNRRIRLRGREKVNYVCPSIDVTMKSLREIPGSRITGIVLTGMGKDGAEGISHIRRIGGTTIAQDEATSTIYGMPKAAVATGSIDYVLSDGEIREKLIQLAG